MRIAFLNTSVSRAGGGVAAVSRQLAQALAADPSLQVEVLGLEDGSTQLDLPAWSPLRPQVFCTRGPRSFGFAPGLKLALTERRPDLAHVHGLWTYPSYAAYGWSRRQQRPYVIAIHGMLSEWALQVSCWKKKIASALFERAVMQHAHCLQASTEQEVAQTRAYGLRNPVCLIPNGIQLPPQETESGDPAPWQDSVSPERNVLLYLGRLHPIKGLPRLLRGWAEFQRREGRTARNWTLVIAGWDENGYVGALKTQVREAGMDESVQFCGALSEGEKAAAFRHASAFVLPSHSEALPTAVLEAWAYGLPVLLSLESGLELGVQHGAALRLEREPIAMGRALATLAGMNDAERRAMGQRGRSLVETRFSWASVTEELRRVYGWLAGGGPTPACVVRRCG